MTFALGFCLGAALTFLALGYGWYRVRATMLRQSLAAERLAYSAGVLVGRREAQTRPTIGNVVRFDPKQPITYTPSRGMN